jgi:hypothetical protein
MAINVLRGRFRAERPEPEPETLAIGEIDREIFGCPVCQRPLAVGTSRCPGCRTRLVMGVPMRRVSVFVALGTTGTIAVVLTAVTLLSVVQAVSARGGASQASPTPGPSNPTRPAPGGGPTAHRVSSVVRSALDQAAAINLRLVAATPQLKGALSRSNLDSPAVAVILRDLAADATRGADLIARFGSWTEADAVTADLDALYRDVRATARTGLAAALTNDRAYRTAAQRMLSVLHRAGPVTQGIRALAVSSGIQLPSLPGDESPVPTLSGASPAPAQPA